MYNRHMLLDLPLILETRRNHALEHATLHILSHTYKIPMAGHSNPTGFFLLGDIQIEDIKTAAAEAQTRLNAGESDLAVHPGCGTNLVAAALLPATFAWAPLRGAKSTRWRILGPWLQKYITTEADLGNMQIVDIRFVRKGLHRVITK